jgi:hypothetical protein
MSANPKLTGEREASPTSERRPTRQKRINSDAIRTMRYDFQVDAGEAYIEDGSWRPFMSLIRREPRRAGKISLPPKVDGSGSGGRGPASK